MTRLSVNALQPPRLTLNFRVLATLFWAGLASFALWAYLESMGSARVLAAASIMVCALGITTISRLSPGSFWSPAGMFFLVMSLFHLGLTPYWILGILPPLGRSSDAEWFLGSFGEIALRAVILGLASYVLGFSLWVLVQKAPAAAFEAKDSNSDTAFILSRCGSLMLLIGILSWFAIVLAAGGIGLLFSPYQVFLEATASTPIAYVYSVIGVGLGMAVINTADRFVKVGILVFFTFGIVAFLLGLRGEVLFPTAVAASVLGFRHRLPGPFATVAIGSAGLLAISVARQVRQFGVGGDGFDSVSWDPMAGLAELGLTLRVVAVVVGWNSGPGDDYAGGETYTVFFARALEGLFASAPPAQTDLRMFNIAIGTREGQIGGSVIGEALHNGGALGVVLVLLLLGALFGYFSSSRPNVARLAVYVAIAVPLFNHVRNSFVPVVPAVAGALCIVTLCLMFSRTPRRSSRGV